MVVISMSTKTTYTLKKASEHIWYEAWMFYDSAEKASSQDTVENHNIQLDAFAIHTRNLFNFFYPSSKQAREDDILAGDYIPLSGTFRASKTKKADLRFILKKADKQVGHLTYRRNRHSSRTKPWPVRRVVERMHKTLEAFDEALPAQTRSWPYFVQLHDLLSAKKRQHRL